MCFVVLYYLVEKKTSGDNSSLFGVLCNPVQCKFIFIYTVSYVLNSGFKIKKNIKTMFLLNSLTGSVKHCCEIWGFFLIALCADTRANRLGDAQCWTLDAGASNWHGRITAVNSQRPRLCHLSLAALCPPAALSTSGDGTQSRPPATKTAPSDFCCCLTSPSTGTLTAQRSGTCCTFDWIPRASIMGIINNMSEKNRRDTYLLPLCHMSANQFLTFRLCLILRRHIETFQDVGALERAAFGPDVSQSCVVDDEWYSSQKTVLLTTSTSVKVLIRKYTTCS